MFSIEARKFLFKLIIVFLYNMNYANACDKNTKLYIEIGCKPIYSNDSNSCPVAYDCENVFVRPRDKCYFNGNIYEPGTELSEADSKLNKCLAGCTCRQYSYFNSYTTAQFYCANVECPSMFADYPIMDLCYHQYDLDSCCEVKTYCPKKEEFVHKCSFNDKTYKNGQRFYVGNYLECVCSPEFNGTANDASCKKINNSYEILYMENILKRSAPVYYEGSNHPLSWLHSEYDVATADVTNTSTFSGYRCKYGDLSLSLGQKLLIGPQLNSKLYTITCSCNTPPLVTCVHVRNQNYHYPSKYN